jgi:putative ABC transport system substrate-binding protein
MSTRREFIALLGGAAAAWPLAARAQQPARSVPKIGILFAGTTPPAPPRMESFRRGLREQGFIEGHSVAVELRYAQKGLQQLPELAAELVQLKVDVILANGDFAPRVAQQATSTIPIVAFTDDILGAGLVASLSRPGGNTTGLTILAPELSAKRLEVLSEIVPGLSRVAALWDPTTGRSQVAMTETAAHAMNMELRVFEVRRREDLSVAFEAARKEQMQAFTVFASPFLASLSREIITFAEVYRIPAIYQWKESVEGGGLMAYGPNLAEMWRQGAVIVTKLLRGAKPAEMPVEQPTKFELVINTKTAKALGLTVPDTLLARADEVIE